MLIPLPPLPMDISVRLPGPGMGRLDMMPGDFRHVTRRNNYRSIVKDVWLATNATPGAWEQLAEFDFPDPLDMSLNTQEDRRRFSVLEQMILERAGLYGGGEEAFASTALNKIIYKIAKHGWQGYMQIEIAARDLAHL